MRTIKFRGKRVDNGEWVYGSLYTEQNSEIVYMITYVMPDELYDTEITEVIPETVGQFTGLQDKNGKDIYEGDVVHYKCSEQQKESEFHYKEKVIGFHNGSFGFQEWYTNDKGNLRENLYRHVGSHGMSDLFYKEFELEIIGNIHEEKK